METKTLDDKDLQLYYDAKLATYASPGWVLLMEEIEQALTQYRDIGSINKEHSLDFRRGQVDILLWMRTQRDMHEMALTSLLQGDAAGVDGDD